MKVRRDLVLKIAIALVIVFSLGLVFLYILPYLRFFRLVRIEAKEARQRKVRLLSETDHQDLLEACREVAGMVSAGSLKPSRYKVRIDSDPDPEISRFPQLILDLEPIYVHLFSDGRVEVELSGAIHHCGVVAYPEDYKKPSRSFEYGDKRILDGLWYYEDEYDEDLDKQIEELLQKRK